MSKGRLVWDDEKGGDQRNKVDKQSGGISINLDSICLQLRRLTSGKGRTVIEISALPNHEKWCKDFAKKIKSKLGVGGTYKNKMIEIHGEKLEALVSLLEKENIKWKKIGG